MNENKNRKGASNPRNTGKDAGNKEIEFAFPSRLQPLFEKGADNDHDEVPFKEPQELMNLLNELEEQNLKLI